MKRVYTIRKKLLLTIVICSLILSNLVGLAIAKEARKNESASIQRTPAQSAPTDIQTTIKGSENSKWSEKLNEIKSKSQKNRSKRLHKEDQFNYSRKDIEQLMLKGATVEDIYLSDQIGNEWLIEPKQLVDQKLSSVNVSWDEIGIGIQKEKEQQAADLLKKHPKMLNALQKKTLNTAEKLEILKEIDQQGEQVLTQVLSSYEANGLDGLKQKEDR